MHIMLYNLILVFFQVVFGSVDFRMVVYVSHQILVPHI